MYQQHRPGFSGMPPVVKNLLIINGLFFLATIMLGMNLDIDLIRLLGLYYFDSPDFEPYQIITHMFMHGGLMHIFFNMFALWMFGRALESVWGPKRFFIYYFITGLGAAALHTGVNALEVWQTAGVITLDVNNPGVSDDYAIAKLSGIYYTPTVGASGAVFGVLLAFGMLFPNTQLMLLFPPIPIRAKYFVLIYGAIELYLGIQNSPSDNVAHFAHLGGMLFGYLLIRFWRKNTGTFY